jgi:hypothetical protein
MAVLKLEDWPLDKLVEYEFNPRKNDHDQNPSHPMLAFQASANPYPSQPNVQTD